jgi:hypothetical protein
MASQPIDHGAILRSGAALIPNYAEQELQQRLMELRQQAQQIDTSRETRLQSQQTRENEQQDAFQRAVQGLGQNPTAAQLAELMYRYPQFSEAINRGFGAMDGARRRTEFQALAEVTEAARGGRFDLAAQALERRIEADRAAGQPEDPMDTAVLRGLRSSDPRERQYAVDFLERSTAAVDPERYSQVYGTFQRETAEMNGIIYDRHTGEPLFQDPRGRIVPGPNGSFNQVPPIQGIPMLGGGSAPTAAATPTAPQTGRQPQPDSGESPADGAGSGRRGPLALNNPGGLRARGSTRFRRFETLADGIAAQERLLAGPRYLANGGTIRSVVETYAPRRRNGGDNSDAQINNYITRVARSMGVSPDDPIGPQHVSQLAAAMRDVESPGWRRRAGQQQSGRGPVRVRSRQQYAALPSGTEYIDPNGVHRRKP